jgi:hypothetical protein
METTVTIVDHNSREKMRGKKLRNIIRQFHEECVSLGIKHMNAPFKLYLEDIKAAYPIGYDVASTFFGFSQVTDLSSIIPSFFSLDFPLKRLLPNNCVTLEQLFRIVKTRLDKHTVEGTKASIELIRERAILGNLMFYSSELFRFAFQEALYYLWKDNVTAPLSEVMVFFILFTLDPFVLQYAHTEKLFTTAINQYVTSFTQYMYHLNTMTPDKLPELHATFFDFLYAFDIVEYLFMWHFECRQVNQAAYDCLNHTYALGMSKLESFEFDEEEDETPIDYSNWSVEIEEHMIAYLKFVIETLTSLRTPQNANYLTRLDSDMYDSIYKLHRRYLLIYQLYLEFLEARVQELGNSAESLVHYNIYLAMKIEFTSNFDLIKKQEPQIFSNLRLLPSEMFSIGTLHFNLGTLSQFSNALRCEIVNNNFDSRHTAIQLRYDSDMISSRDQLCFICLSNKRHYVLHPCGHLVFCELCVNKFASGLAVKSGRRTDDMNQMIEGGSCPLCRTIIKSAMRIIF